MTDRQPPSRRQVLAAAGAAWATAALSPWADRPAVAQAADGDRPLGWAVVGIGSFTRGQVLPGLARCKHSRCVAIVTGHPDKVNQPIRKLGGKSVRDAFGLGDGDVYTYDRFDALRDNPKVDVIYIVLPTGLHVEYTTRAFAAGKHVMCEKPMANTTAECDQMIAAATAAGKRLQIGYRMRWDGPTTACIEAIGRGDIGRVQSIQVAQGFDIEPNVWRLDRKLAGGGSLMDIGVYAVSAARYLAGEEPTEVVGHTYADPNDPRFAQVEGTCDFHLRYPSGAMASGSTSYACMMGRFAAYGSKGSAVMDPSSGYSEPPRFGGTAFSLAKGGGPPQRVDVTPTDQFVSEYDGFSLALKGAGPFKAVGEEGRQDIRVIEAIYASAKSGRAVTLA